MCFICGLKNKFGLYTSFFETEDNLLISIFKPKNEHQGYPGRLHGGIAAAILDETIGRTINIGKKEQVWGVTLEFKIKYKKPIPLNEKIRAVAMLDNENKRIFEGKGKIILPDGTTAAEGKGKYLKMPIEKITNFDLKENEWHVVSLPDDPCIIEL